MGIYVDIALENIRIPRKHEVAALKAINRLNDREMRKLISYYHDKYGSDDVLCQISFPQGGFKTLKDALTEWKYEMSRSGNFIKIVSATGLRKFGDDDILYAALAPFVVDGGMIEIVVEECNEKFVYTFAKGQVTETLFHWEPGVKKRIKSMGVITFLQARKGNKNV